MPGPRSASVAEVRERGRPSAVAIVELLRASGSDIARVAADIDAFVDALLFTWIIAGPDAHAKNYSVLLDGNRARLAPLYDLASILPYGDHVPKVKLAMKVGGTTSCRRSAGRRGFASPPRRNSNPTR